MEHGSIVAAVVFFLFFVVSKALFFLFLIFLFLFFISWRLITLQYCSGFCHTLT